MQTVAALALALAFGGCDADEAKETPAQKVVKAQCHDLFVHVVTLQGRDPKLVDDFPVESTEECAAGEPEIRACMLVAKDMAGVKACIPADDVIGCMQKVANIPSIRAKCWNGDAASKGDAKAADKIGADVLACAERGKSVPGTGDKCVTDPHAADGIKAAE